MSLEVFLIMFIGGLLYSAVALLKTAILAGILAAVNGVLGEGDLSEIQQLVRGAGETVLLDKALKALVAALRRSSGERWLG
ncbi:MAG: hypothetical protein J7L79_04780 [Thaumarchaeota archaeon]|nr:hypothetical protein [Nitrososphaerota archaeon]